MLKKYATEYIVSIEDITDMVKEQEKYAMGQGSIVKLSTPVERVYPVEDEETCKRLELDVWEEPPETEDVLI